MPDEIDDCTAAAIANPGMSSWAALTERAKLQSGETVLINGATGRSRRLAIQIAKHLGASKVIATGRNPQSLQGLQRQWQRFRDPNAHHSEPIGTLCGICAGRVENPVGPL